LVVTSPALPFADTLASHGSLSGSSGVGSASNVGATKEVGETNHVGKIGGKSVWVSWTPSASGIATFSTRGSSFDTLLAIYTGASVASLVPVAADEDRGGFLTSQASFNATNGTEYLIAIDGFAGASGNIVLSWSLDTSTVPFPRIITPPLSQTVINGATVAFSVAVDNPTALTYQWFHECRAIDGATNATLTISPVRPADVGAYRVVVRNASSIAASSVDAFLEIGRDPKGLSQDKLEDLLAGADIGGLAASAKAPADVAAFVTPGFVSVSVGTFDAQLFNNTGSTTQEGETNHCGVLGGASRWFGLRAEADADFLIDTVGSSIDTVLAVYYRTNVLNLYRNLVACDNNGAPDGIRSRVRFGATAGRDYLVVVDGVGVGVQGAITLNWVLGRGPPIGSGPVSQCMRQGQTLTLQADTNGVAPGPTYQWFWNGTAIAGATNRTFTVTAVQTTQGGVYSVMMSNPFGAVTNLMAVVTVKIPYLSVERAPTPGTLRLGIEGPPEQALVLETSLDLARWSPFYTNSASNGVRYLDVPTTNGSGRFYRARPLP
jgi:hypothetical protein